MTPPVILSGQPRAPTTPIEDGPPPGFFWVRIQDNAEADIKPPERILEYPIPPEFALGTELSGASEHAG